MVNKLSLGTSILALLVAASHANAQSIPNLSYDIKVGVGSTSNMDGGMGLDSNGGIYSAITRGFAEIDASLGFGLGSGDIQLDLNAAAFELSNDPSIDVDDTTALYSDIAVHYARDFSGTRVGGFVGLGYHVDNGDSSEEQTYWYAGIEFARDVSFGQYFGSIGYFTSEDEYNEGTQDAPFIRIGALYNFNDDLSLLGALSYAGGVKYDNGYPNTTIGLELGAEYQMSDRLSGYATYELDRISYEDSGQYGDTFHNISVGFRFAVGGQNGSTWTTPDFGRWVAFNANEIE